MREVQHVVAGRPVRSLLLGAPSRLPEVVVVPGLGALGYLLPTVRTCASWTRVHLLDVPGFGRWRTARLPSDLDAVTRAVAGWLAATTTRPVLLVGHSTGAQAALRAGLSVPEQVHALVLAGATFAPDARRLPPLAGRVARTLPHERPGELPAVLPYYLRGVLGIPSLLRSALDDRPEDVVAQLRPPLLVLRGEHDRLCDREWAEQLAATGRLQVLPGAHNFPYSHARETSEALRAFAGERPSLP